MDPFGTRMDRMLQDNFIEELGDVGFSKSDYVLMVFEPNVDPRRKPPTFYTIECTKEYIDDEDGNRLTQPTFKILKGMGKWTADGPKVNNRSLQEVLDKEGNVLEKTPEGIQEWLLKEGEEMGGGEFSWEHNS
jgi:hypothetical protein